MSGRINFFPRKITGRRSRYALFFVLLTISVLKCFCDGIIFASNGFACKNLSSVITKQYEHNSDQLLTMDLDVWNSFPVIGACKDQDKYLKMNRTRRNDYWFPFTEEIKKDGFVIISNVNCGYIDFALNFWKHYQQLEYNNLVFIAEDCDTFSYLVRAFGRHHVAPPVLNDGDKDAQIYGSKGFGKLASMRPIYMHYFLNRGVSVLWQDLDSVPFQDPMKFIPRGFDAVLIDGESTDFHYSSNNLCSCFIYMNPSFSSLSTLQLWIEELKKMEKNIVNQPGFNRAISKAKAEQKITIAILPRSVFPNGRDYDRFMNTSAWIHANYRKGAELKQEFLIQRRAWLIKEKTHINC